MKPNSPAAFFFQCALFRTLTFTQNAWAGLVAHWPLDESAELVAADVAGGNSLNLINFPGDDSQWVAGMVAGGLDFDRVDDYLQIADAAIVGSIPAASSTPAADFSIALWVNAADLTGRRLLVAKQSEPERGFALMLEDGVVTFEAWPTGAGSASTIASSAVLSAGTYYYITIAYDSGADEAAIYINGNLDNTATAFGGPPRTNSQDLNLGRYYWNAGFNWHFQGILDDVRVYD